MTYIISTDTGEEYEADEITRVFLGEKACIPARQRSFVYFLNPYHVVSIKKAEPVDRPKAKGEHFWGDWHDRGRDDVDHRRHVRHPPARPRARAEVHGGRRLPRFGRQALEGQGDMVRRKRPDAEARPSPVVGDAGRRRGRGRPVDRHGDAGRGVHDDIRRRGGREP